jgi:hypothetical protein
MVWMKMRRLQAKACLLFINAVPSECLSEGFSIGFPHPDILRPRINAINDLNYLRPSLIKSNRIEDIAAPNIGDASLYGHFEKLSKAENGAFVATGWAGLPERGEPAHAVLLTYQKDQGAPMIFALVEMKIEQPSFAALFAKAPSSDWHWQKSVSLDKAPVALPVSINAWAFDATTGKAYKLDGTYLVEDENGEPRFQGTGNP